MSLEETTTNWIDAQKWLETEHDILTTGLLMAAESLDRKFQASTMAEYRKMYEQLLGMKPQEQSESDDEDLSPLDV